MNLDEFELQIRNVIEQTLNQLQTVTLLVSQLETRISETGQAVQTIGQLAETFVLEQREQPSSEG
jgi:hypothetical protein